MDLISAYHLLSSGIGRVIFLDIKTIDVLDTSLDNKNNKQKKGLNCDWNLVTKFQFFGI